MSTRQQPETSMESYRALTDEKLSKDYSDILSALKTLNKAHYEDIAIYLGWTDINKSARRMKELEERQQVYKTGEKKLTKRGRNAYVYCLCNPEKVEAVKKKETVLVERPSTYRKKTETTLIDPLNLLG